MTAEIPCIDLPDSWRADCAVPEGQECATCSWNGKWADLLSRRCGPFDSVRLTREQLQKSLVIDPRLCCAVLLALLDKAEGGNKSSIKLHSNFFALYPDTLHQSARNFGACAFTVSDDGISAPGICCITPWKFPSVDTSSQRSLEWAKAQIQECIANHEECRTEEHNFLPSRLIYVHPDADNEPVLRCRQDIKPGTKYVALSHCWGEPEHWPECLTTAETLCDRMNNIAWATIPPTFRDAISFTRRLGLEYIWIDSVCIIQHDKEDWETESVLMKSVYSNAFLTLAAVASHDNRGGLFRPPDDQNSLQLLSIRWKGSEQQLFAYFSSVDGYDSLSSHLDTVPKRSGSHAAHFPLLTRAWAFQERLVSRRTLLFGKGQLLLECCLGRVFEGYGPEAPPTAQPLTTRRLHNSDEGRNVIRRRLAEAVANPSVEEIAVLWRDLVDIYSSMSLTMPKDRLPAISAVAQKLQAVCPLDTYFCGVWRQSFHEHVLWMPGRGYERLIPLPVAADQPYVAPSWSWASYPAPVHFEYRPPHLKHFHSRIEVIGNAVIPEYGDSCGRVSLGSHIIVRAKTMDALWFPYWVPLEACPSYGPLPWRAYGLTRYQSFLLPLKSQGKPQQWLEVDFFSDYSDYHTIDWYARLDGTVPVCLLHVAEETCFIREAFLGWALILYKDLTTGRYRRIGYSKYKSGKYKMYMRTNPVTKPLIAFQCPQGEDLSKTDKWKRPCDQC